MNANRRHLVSAAPRRAAAALALLLAGLLCAGCQERLDTQGRPLDAPGVDHPAVDRDLGRIRESGVLRLVTHYSSSSYFIHKGGPAGFDYELVERFAREHKLSVDVVIPRHGEDMVSLLNAGKGDIVCAGMTADPGLERWVTQTRPTNFVQKVVVLPAGSTRPATFEGLAGLTLTVPHDDGFRAELQELRDASRMTFFIASGRPSAGPDELIAQVARGEIEACVVDDIIARAALVYEPGVRLGALLGERRPTVWLVRQNCPDLKNALNAFLRENIRVAEDGRTRRSQTYGIIYDRYFENPLTIREYRAPAHRPDKSGAISIYDDMIRTRAEAAGLDWRFVAALIYQESRFYPFARSRADARGLMQVLPDFAGPQADSLYVPEANMTAGLRLLRNTFDAYAYLDSLERWRFTLAEYHAGHGHVTDARRLAMEAGRNPNRWRGSLAWALPKLMERRHYEGTRHGFYGGAKTVQYVEDIMNRARVYARLVPRFPPEGADAERRLPALTRARLLPELAQPPDPE